MDESEKQSDLDIKRLSLIDVSFEDDSLFNSSLVDPISILSSEKGSEPKSVRFSEAVDTNNTEAPTGTFEEYGQIEEPHQSLEVEKTKKNGKYNLRKSLAWDSAFFTSAGVLDPEELSSMIGGTEKSEKQTLPGIQEDINRSCDSLTTLDSDTLTLESLEADLFGDIRASIQKSNKSSDISDSSSKKESGVPETRTVSSTKKIEVASKDKIKLKANVRKPSISMQESGKALKRASARPPISQSVTRNGESNATLHKPPKLLSRATASTIPATSTKRVSLSAKHVKMENAVKSGTGRGVPVSKNLLSGGSRNIVPRPTLSSKSSSMKSELTTSCSSLDSSGSASSGSITKSSLNSVRGKNDTRTSNSSSSGTAAKTPSRIASRGGKQTASSQLSALLKSGTNLSSSISPSSSISEWSSGSPSSTSAVNQGSNLARASHGTGSCKRISADGHVHQLLDAKKHSSTQCLVGNGSSGTSGLLHPASMRPSGLRMPSPKIGFFDGMRSSGRTPSGLSHPRVASSSPKIGAGSINLNGSSNNTNLGKFQPTRTPTATRSTKTDVKQTSLSTKPRSSLPHQDSPNTTATTSASRNIKSSRCSPNILPKIQSKSSPKTSGKIKEQGVGTEASGVTVGDSDFSLNEKIRCPDFPKQKVGQDTKGSVDMKDANIPPVNAGSANNGDCSSKSDAGKTIPSQVAGENENCRHPLETDVKSCSKTDEKKEAHFEDHDAGLINQVGARNINVETQIELAGNSPFLREKNNFVNGLSQSPTLSPPVASDLTGGLRKPLAEMDSLFNREEPLDVSTGSTVGVGEKATALPIPDRILPENA